MSHRHFPLALLLVALLVGFPGQSFATSMGTDAISPSDSGSKSSKKDDEKIQELLKEIFTLGGVFSSGGGSRNSRKAPAETDGSSSSNEWDEERMGDVFRPPIIYPKDPVQGNSDLAAPVPEPTGALLFGMGILAVSAGRARSKRQR